MIKIKKHDRRACCSAFLLFVFTGVLTLSVLVGALFANPARMVRSLGGDTYVDGLYTEVHQYAADLCLEYGLDTAVADAVTKDGVRSAVQTYAKRMLKSKDRSAKLTPALQEVRTALEAAAAKAAPGATTAQVQDFGKAFADYMSGRMALVFAADLQSFANLSTRASAAGGVIACCGVALAVWLLGRSGAAKRLQRLLAADGICAAGLVTVLCAVIMLVLLHQKDLYIFPAYLCAAATQYMIGWLYMCLGAGGLLLAASGIVAFARKGKNCKG